MPLVDQLKDLSRDMASGPMEFVPSPSEMVSLISNGYNTKRNLLVRFESDPIDQTSAIESLLRVLNRDVRVKSVNLDGGHLRPNVQSSTQKAQQRAVETVASANPALQEDFPGLGPTPASAGAGRDPAMEDMDELVDQIVQWMGISS